MLAFAIPGLGRNDDNCVTSMERHALGTAIASEPHHFAESSFGILKPPPVAGIDARYFGNLGSGHASSNLVTVTRYGRPSSENQAGSDLEISSDEVALP